MLDRDQSYKTSFCRIGTNVSCFFGQLVLVASWPNDVGPTCVVSNRFYNFDHRVTSITSSIQIVTKSLLWTSAKRRTTPSTSRKCSSKLWSRSVLIRSPSDVIGLAKSQDSMFKLTTFTTELKVY